MKTRSATAFSLLELFVSIGVLGLLVVLIAQLFSGATAVTGLGSKQMEANAQARAVFERMALDFGRMVRRADVDYFLKDDVKLQAGNDQLAFFSEVPGYYAPGNAATVQSPVSLVGYRINPNLQRLGYGLAWSGPPPSSVVYTSVPSTIPMYWPAATNMDPDPSYELAGPDVFRLEYFYLIKGQILSNGAAMDPTLSVVPWDTRIKDIPGVRDHTTVSGLQDVSAIGVVIAVIDPKSRASVTETQLAGLASAMDDFSATNKPGDLEDQWSNAIESSNLPRLAASGIRVYSRYFHLSPSATLNP